MQLNAKLQNEVDETVVTGNTFDKYRSRNPIHRRLINGFLATATRLLSQIKFERVLEIGCGPGDLAFELFCRNPDSLVQYMGIDVGQDQVFLARTRYPMLRFEQANAYEVPACDNAFDVVVACEVLEHLTDPSLALAEMRRVTSESLLLSVPREPVWRILNMARGKYLSAWGNTPGHRQHFSRGDIVSLVARYFEVQQVRSPFPWTMLLAKKRD